MKGIILKGQTKKVYEKTPETIALLKMLAISGKELKNGNYKPLSESFEQIRKEIERFKYKRTDN